MNRLPQKPLIRILLTAIAFVLVLTLYVWWQRAYFLPQMPEKPLTLTVIMPDAIIGHAALRQGMEQAAFDTNCEVYFVHPLEEGNLAEQEQLLAREITLQADGIVIYPLDTKAIQAQIEHAAKTPPLLLLDVPQNQAGGWPSVSGNYQALGDLLIGRIRTDSGHPESLLLIYREPLSGNAAILYDALTRSFATSDIRALGLSGSRQDAAAQIAKQTYHPEQTVVVLDASGLTLLGDHVASHVAGASRPLIYGLSRDATDAARLEQGIFTALAVENEFSAGYLAISNLADLIRKKTIEPHPHISFALIDRDNIDTAKSQHLLFPIVQ